MLKRIYIAGPMRGYPLFNFPAFDAAAKRFAEMGWEVVNPAQMDRELGFDGTGPLPDGFTDNALERDKAAIRTCQAIALLPGWHKSEGVTKTELPLALGLCLEIYDAVTCTKMMLPLDRDPVVLPPEPPMAKAAYTKPTNPKDIIGSDKLPLHLWPTVASAHGCLALLDGALKYGRSNWREAGVKVSIYIDAALRHLSKYWEGQETDPDSGLDHRAHALACIAILLDAEAAGKLIDDRAYRGAGAVDALATLTEIVKRIKATHTKRTPKHWTIADKS